MKRIALLACTLAISSASAAAPSSTTPNPTLGYTATGGRGLGLKLANEDGSAASEVYRFANGARFDLSSAADHRILIIDNHQLFITSWSIGARGVTAAVPYRIYGGPRLVTAAAFSQDGLRLAYATDDNYVTILDSGTLSQLSRFAADGIPNGISWMPDGNSLVILLMDNVSPYLYRLVEHSVGGGAGMTLLTEPNINDFDTGRVPGDRNLLVSFGRPGFSGIGVWDPAVQAYTGYLPAQGSSAVWNCPQTRTTLKSAADEGVYTIDVITGAKQVIYKGVQGRFPRYMKCARGAATAATTARERGRANRFIHISRPARLRR